MKRVLAIAAVGLGLTAGAAGVLGLRSPATPSATPGAIAPVWSEAAWPFPIDQWGEGWAFQCQLFGKDARSYESFRSAPSTSSISGSWSIG